MLVHRDYIVGKYISIKTIIEKSKVSYYETLWLSSIGWHENKNDYKPFVKFYLGVLVSAYRVFSSRGDTLRKKD